MSALNRPDNFAGRVNYAAQVIAAGRRTSRAFDNCFENGDGDAVAAAILRRAERNQKIADNWPRYLSRQTAQEAAEKLAGRDLTAESARLRAESAAAWAEMLSRAHDKESNDEN